MVSILYIDDDPEDLEIFEEAVKVVDPSIHYTGTTCAHSAIKFLQTDENIPNFIFIDINMPGMDGKLCLEAIRKDKRLDSVNIFIYSTNSFPTDLERIEALNATYLRKVNSFQDLCNLIQNLTEHH